MYEALHYRYGVEYRDGISAVLDGESPAPLLQRRRQQQPQQQPQPPPLQQPPPQQSLQLQQPPQQNSTTLKLDFPAMVDQVVSFYRQHNPQKTGQVRRETDFCTGVRCLNHFGVFSMQAEFIVHKYQVRQQSSCGAIGHVTPFGCCLQDNFHEMFEAVHVRYQVPFVLPNHAEQQPDPTKATK